MIISKEKQNQLIKMIGKNMYYLQKLEEDDDSRYYSAKLDLYNMVDDTIEYLKRDQRIDINDFLFNCKLVKIVINECHN